MEVVFEARNSSNLWDCSGYDTTCWCNDVACQGQND